MESPAGTQAPQQPPSGSRSRPWLLGSGLAGAIDLFGSRYGLPAALSGHQNYFLWGWHGYTGQSMIVMGGDQEDLEQRFASVRKMAHLDNPYSMPDEHSDIFYCQGLKQPLSQLWPQVKNWN